MPMVKKEGGVRYSVNCSPNGLSPLGLQLKAYRWIILLSLMSLILKWYAHQIQNTSISFVICGSTSTLSMLINNMCSLRKVHQHHTHSTSLKMSKIKKYFCSLSFSMHKKWYSMYKCTKVISRKCMQNSIDSPS